MRAKFSIGVGFTIALCVYTAYATSGAHMNQAVSLAMFATGALSFSHFLGYAAVQLAASYFGTALAYFVYRGESSRVDERRFTPPTADQILHFTNGTKTIVGSRATAAMFCGQKRWQKNTLMRLASGVAGFPDSHLSNFGLFVDQVG